MWVCTGICTGGGVRKGVRARGGYLDGGEGGGGAGRRRGRVFLPVSSIVIMIVAVVVIVVGAVNRGEQA